MNREQAIICMNFLGAAETKIIFPEFNVDCWNVMCRWARGEVIVSHLDSMKNFNDSPLNYKFKQETHIVNEREAPAPYRVEPKVVAFYYSINDTGGAESNRWGDYDYDNAYFNLGNCFKSRSDAQENSDAIWRK